MNNQNEQHIINKEPILSTRQLNKFFFSGPEKLTIFDGLDLDLCAGESVAILGASGSGKSTLLYLLGGLDRPNSGQVLFKGQDVFKADDDKLAAWRNKEVGFVFQFHHLLSDFTALENVAMPARLSGIGEAEALKQAEPFLVRVGLSERMKHRPGAMSGGEQQRVALARALVMKPSVLLADEPTGNLDNKTAAAVNGLILDLVAEEGLTAVVVTHNRELAKLMGRQLELENGQLTPAVF